MRDDKSTEPPVQNVPRRQHDAGRLQCKRDDSDARETIMQRAAAAFQPMEGAGAARKRLSLIPGNA
jgi:hypothetical protein